MLLVDPVFASVLSCKLCGMKPGGDARTQHVAEMLATAAGSIFPHGV